MAQTVTQFPPGIIAEKRVKISCGNGTKSSVWAKQTASGFPVHNFPSSLDYEVPCYSGHGHGPPTSCQLSTQTLSFPSPTTYCHVSPWKPTLAPTSQSGNEGGSNGGDEFDADTSCFADMFKFGWELLSKLRRNESSVYKIHVLNEYKQAYECIYFLCCGYYIL
jgi:hypothetical protein